MSHSFRIITLGCKVNQYESVYLQDALTREGWHESKAPGKSDVVIVNTCVVTQRAAHQSRQAVRRAVRENPDALVAAVGCYPQIDPDVFAEMPGVGLVAGNADKGSLPKAILLAVDSGTKWSPIASFRPGMSFEPMPIGKYAGRTRAFLKIQDGCESFCAYCIVPYTRGPSRSLPPGEVIEGLRCLSEAGYKEVVLTGVHLGNYGLDLPGGGDLVRLLRDLAGEGFPTRIRLSSLEPSEICRDLLEMAGEENRLCPHFHISLQSGDDRILKRMNRSYRRSEFAAIIQDIHDLMPGAAIGVDVIAGFPGEDPEAHANTRSLLEDLPISYLHVFPFSPRPGTVAAGLRERVGTNAVKQRAAELRALGQEKRSLFYQGCLNQRLSVLVEGRCAEDQTLSRGTSANYLSVLFPSSRNREGEILPVMAMAVKKNRVLGSIVDDEP